jgi:hypothetical protein
MTPKTTTAPTGEALLTLYYVLESKDKGHTWSYLGRIAAGDSAAALRKFFNDPPREQNDEELFHVAVSVSSFKPRKVAARVKTSISEAEMPEAANVETPEQPAEDIAETLPV